MLLKEFLSELAKLKHRRWRVCNQRIRNDRNVCPVSAVANEKAHRLKFTTVGYLDAGKYLGLSPRTAHAIANAADHSGYKWRRQILAALKLEEAV